MSCGRVSVIDAIRARRTVRKFKCQPVPADAIRLMIEAATWAPSASNRQPWRYMVVTAPAMRRQLVACVQEAISRTAGAVQPGYGSDYLSYARHFMHFEKAPVLIVALFRAAEAMASIFQADSQAHARMRNLELDGAKISTAMAVQNMILCAAEQGVGTCVMSGPLIASESMARVLAVPDGWDILCLVCAGYPDESPEPPRRKSVDQVVIPVGEPGGSDGV